MQGNEILLQELKKIDPTQPYGTALFDALTRLTVSVAIEAVCLRWNQQKKIVEVYMVQRSPDDTAYPGEWHCPGSFLRPGEDISSVFARLSKREFKANLSPTQFVANVNHPTEARGHVISVVYLCGLEAGDLKGRWFSVDSLPENTVETHAKRIIPVAVGAFLADCTSICS